MGRKPTVGGKAEHSQFAKDITAYVDSVREATGLSIRQLADLTEGQRGKSWWADILNGKNILTTNDVHYIATLLGISPYEMINEARRLAKGPLRAVRTFNVDGITEDDYQQEPSADQVIPTRKAAKRGAPKVRKAFEGDDEGASGDGGESGA